VATAGQRRRRSGPGRRRSDNRGWTLLLAGLAVGAAAVATYNYVRGQLQAPPATEAAPGKPARPPAVARVKPQEKPAEQRFEFYEMLPNFEVVVPEEDHDVRPDKTPAPVEVPGVYVLQAGSYASFAEADKVKARLALLGIRSQIQKISVDERQYHRVRIGPIERLDELNRTRQKLRTARIDTLVIRVGE